MNDLIEKIREIAQEFQELENKKDVLVMHPSVAWQCREFITSYVNPTTHRFALMLDNKTQCYLSNKLAVNHFALMKKAQYDKDFALPDEFDISKPTIDFYPGINYLGIGASAMLKTHLDNQTKIDNARAEALKVFGFEKANELYEKFKAEAQQQHLNNADYIVLAFEKAMHDEFTNGLSFE